MSVKYCPHCGEKNTFVGKAPNFCNYCGSSFSSKSINLNNRSNSTTNTEQIETFDADYTDANYVPNITKLSYETEGFQKKTFKFDELISEEQRKTQET